MPLRIFSRETIVAGLVLCGGSIEQFNTHYNAWRRKRSKAIIVVMMGPGDEVRCDEEPQFLDFVKDAPPSVDERVSRCDLLANTADVQLLHRNFLPAYTISPSTAANALCICDGDADRAIAILQRLLPALDTGGEIDAAWLLWNVARLYDDKWASLREDWRAPKEVLHASI